MNRSPLLRSSTPATGDRAASAPSPTPRVPVPTVLVTAGTVGPCHDVGGTRKYEVVAARTPIVLDRALRRDTADVITVRVPRRTGVQSGAGQTVTA